ncbi:uncharacterized protein LOC108864480 [Galendromus occidentalis]|uniref:Uncharacterized protein LOC108864480 n=1 Tax=Galendromus occidentalis TaxID=34638 RepID=A0AAJ7SFH3_9ACAR|nr:uncharacterized protein LOC108864480 [Galendromus occidentalis]
MAEDFVTHDRFAIANSLTPHRGDGSRFSYSASWGTLPECAAQQVCSALYVRLNRTQPLCQCSNQFKDPCSKTDYVDEHSIKLISSGDKKKAYNLVKVCEPVMSIRRCKSPQDWQLLALQSTRTGKSHYLVVCRCPTGSSLLGPIKHNNPPYANIPGIRVYGMLCSQRRGNRQVKEKELPPVPWDRLLHLARQSGLTNITLPFS